jgi:hypothetical protein
MKGAIIALTLVLLTACSIPSFTRTQANSISSIDLNICADKIAMALGGVAISGTFDCADPTYKAFLVNQGIIDDTSLAAYGAKFKPKVGICTAMTKIDGTLSGKAYYVSGYPDGSAAVEVVEVDTATGQIHDIIGDETKACKAVSQLI